MRAFTQHTELKLFEFTAIQLICCICLCLIVGTILGFAVNWKVGLGVGLGLLLLIYAILFYVWFGSHRKNWNLAFNISKYLASKLDSLQLLAQILFCNEPSRRSRETANVKFLFTNNARMAGVVGEKSISSMITTLCKSLEQEYGLLCTRLYRVFKPKSAHENGKFKKLCCVPYFIIVTALIVCLIACLSLLFIFLKQEDGFKKLKNDKSSIITISVLAGILGVATLTHLFTWSRMLVEIFVSPRRRLNQISSDRNSVRLEGYIENMKKEVEMVSSMTKCMDSFRNKHTRLVVIIDGLDSCEQDKLLQVCLYFIYICIECNF